MIRTNHQSDIRLALNAFELLDARARTSLDGLSVRAVAWIRDMAACLALERHLARLRRCADVIVLTASASESPVGRRLTQCAPGAVTGASYAEYVREIGHAVRAAKHVLLFGVGGDLTPQPAISAYVRYERALRALIGSEDTLASAIERLDRSEVVGALTPPGTGRTLGAEAANWHAVAGRVQTLLPTLGIDVPVHPDKPAWGPPGGVLLARSDMLETDWDLAAAIMERLGGGLPDEAAGALLASMVPFVVQSHGRLLAFALPPELAAMPAYSSQVQALASPSRRPLHRRVAGRAFRDYRKLRHRLRTRAKGARR